MCRDLRDIEITSGLLKLRELQLDDKKALLKIVRDYAEFSTLRLYRAYQENRREIEKNMNKTRLNYLFKVFRILDEYSSLYGDSEIRKKLSEFCNEDLFSPYGPMNENRMSFTENGVKRYIEEAQINRISLRDTFRMGIEYENCLIGCIVFDTIKRKIKLKGDKLTTIGDVGVFMNSLKESRLQLLPSIRLILYFVDNYLKLENKSDLYISMTTHLCNQETKTLLRTSRGFQLVKNREEELIPSKYGLRKQYVIPYSMLIKTMYPRDHENIIVKIGNTIVN